MQTNQPEQPLHSPLIKYTRPSSYDFAPYSQQWIFMEDKIKEKYIQLSEDENHLRWERMGYLLERAFEDLFQNQEFITECLRAFKHKEEDPLIKITEIIKNSER